MPTKYIVWRGDLPDPRYPFDTRANWKPVKDRPIEASSGPMAIRLATEGAEDGGTYAAIPASNITVRQREVRTKQQVSLINPDEIRTPSEPPTK